MLVTGARPVVLCLAMACARFDSGPQPTTP